MQAKPGDIAICIEPSNVGKQCHIDKQCACCDEDWKTTVLEPFNCYGIVQDVFMFKTRCPAGAELCIDKKYLVKKEDPNVIDVETREVNAPASTVS